MAHHTGCIENKFRLSSLMTIGFVLIPVKWMEVTHDAS